MSELKNFTRAQKANLKKLATYLEALPEDYTHFDMEGFTSLDAEDEAKYARENGGLDKYPCGTVACAVGHGPSAGVPFRKGKDFYTGIFRFCQDTPEPDWDVYSTRFAPADTQVWIFLFGCVWSGIDNTHRGAAARIRYILDGNSLPAALNDYAYLDCTGEDEVAAILASYKKYLVVGDDHIQKLEA